MRAARSLALVSLCASPFSAWAGRDASKYAFEDLGRPIKSKPVNVTVATTDASGCSTVWAIVKCPERNGLLGIDPKTGESRWVSVPGASHTLIAINRAKNGHLYMYAGNPGHFFKYDVNEKKLTDLGAPGPSCTETMGCAVGPDGRFYVGSVPSAGLACLDPATEKMEELGPIPEDPRQKYVLYTMAVSNDDVTYIPCGLHHAELWARDNRTGRKCQILPDEFIREVRSVRVWTGTDGRVYGKGGDRTFLCKPGGVVFVDKAPPRRVDMSLKRAGMYTALRITSGGELLLKHSKTGRTKKVQTDFEGETVRIYSVCCEHEGKIYGGGLHPSNLFSFDPPTGRLEDLGRHSGGRVQLYDALSHPKGLFLSSYSGACQNFYDPETRKTKHIVTLSVKHDQERAPQLTLGPDGMIYLGTVPTKGRLGGAICRIDPDDFSFKVWRNVIHNQSLGASVSVPQTGELFLVSSVHGSAAVATEKEACVFLWDCKKEEVAWRGRPLPGTKAYLRAMMGRNGLICGVTYHDYFIFDPVKRKTLHTAKLPVKRTHIHYLADEPSGPDGLVYGRGEDAIFAINLSDYSARIIARHPSIRKQYGMYATKDGVLYYGVGSHMWRVNLNP